ncbi:MAG TPA: YqeG family HAD IIIA-type phosphatase [Firmicutes bacterium]|nr:YqeG family HAD IIIA-type phosphatase [Bacillota bacterium]
MKLLLPKQVCNRVTDINLAKLRKLGISGLMLDLDNTLVRYDSEELDQEFKAWIAKAKSEGFRICLVSNGRPKRVMRFARLMEIPAVIRAYKPKRSPFFQALKLLDKAASQVAMIGDQLFTDVLGANRIGIHTILITPLGKKEFSTTRMVRKLEQRMLKRFVKKGLLADEVVNQRSGGEQ